MLVEKYNQEIQNIIAKYPSDQRKAAVMPLLHLVQREQMYIDHDSMVEIADILGMTATEVASVVGFYSLYYDKPNGKYHLQVCTDLPCALRGADNFLHELCQRLEIKPGETTSDGLISVEPVMCLAACDKAPMFQIHSGTGITYHQNQKVENAMSLIDQIRADAVRSGMIKPRSGND